MIQKKISSKKYLRRRNKYLKTSLQKNKIKKIIIKKIYEFPLEFYLRIKIIDQDQYKAALIYRNYYEKSHTNLRSCLNFGIRQPFRYLENRYYKNDYFSKKYEDTYKKLYQNSKTSSIITNKVVLYDGLIEKKYYKFLEEGLSCILKK